MARGKGKGRGKPQRGRGMGRRRVQPQSAAVTRPSQSQNDVCLDDRIPVLLISRLESMDINPRNLGRTEAIQTVPIATIPTEPANSESHRKLPLETSAAFLDSSVTAVTPVCNSFSPDIISFQPISTSERESEVYFDENEGIDSNDDQADAARNLDEEENADLDSSLEEDGIVYTRISQIVASSPGSESIGANSTEMGKLKSMGTQVEITALTQSSESAVVDKEITLDIEDANSTSTQRCSTFTTYITTSDVAVSESAITSDFVRDDAGLAMLTNAHCDSAEASDVSESVVLAMCISPHVDMKDATLVNVQHYSDSPSDVSCNVTSVENAVSRDMEDKDVNLSKAQATQCYSHFAADIASDGNVEVDVKLEEDNSTHTEFDCDVACSGSYFDVMDKTVQSDLEDKKLESMQLDSTVASNDCVQMGNPIREDVKGEKLGNTQRDSAGTPNVPDSISVVMDSVIRASVDNPSQTTPSSSKSKAKSSKAKSIRRSSRIETLESRRGGQRRREVVFSGSWEKESRTSTNTGVGEDESNQLSNITVATTPSPLATKTVSGVSTGFSSPPRDTNGTSLANVILSPASLLKLKSRWRFSSDAESLNFPGTEPETSQPLTVPTESADELQHNPNLVKKSGFILYDQSDTELAEKLAKFQGIDENVFRSAQRTISKESRGLLCDCYLSKDEIIRGEIGCNENCLNRLLMVECGVRCPTGERCTNKKFQRKEYCKLEVFKTEKKGHGLRTRQSLPSGGFVIEYIGEVLDPRGFARRTKEYAKDNQEHFYFMALKSDSIIDATQKGNCSRFINHSCDPNCETQKWTVNGELRIGFFAIKDLAPGEEITFDYQFQRYGKEAQKCFCLASNCRGWIGGDENEEGIETREDDETEVGPEETETTVVRPKVKRRYVRKQKKAEQLEDKAFEEELSKLASSGLRNKNQTLSLCRLMVRAEKWEARERILNILVNGDTPCRRLFLDYHGLRLIWGWMLALPTPTSETDTFESDQHHKLFIKTLNSLPIPNKTMLQDSKVLSVVEKWSQATPVTTRLVKIIKPEVSEMNSATKEECVQPVAVAQLEEPFKSSPDEEPRGDLLTGDAKVAETSAKTDEGIIKIKIEPTEVDVEPMDSVAAHIDGDEDATVKVDASESMDVSTTISDPDKTAVLVKVEEASESLGVTNANAVSELPDTILSDIKPSLESLEDASNMAESVKSDIMDETVTEQLTWDFVDKSKELLASWSSLQEVFRIPKKERVEQMKEHEREADKSDRQRTESDKEKSVSSYDRDRGSSKYRSRTDRRTSSTTSDSHSTRDRDRPRDYFRNRVPGQEVFSSDAYSHLSKEERRNLFAARVAQKEAKDREQRITDETVSLHQERCLRLGLDAATTPVVDPSCVYYLDASTITWKEINFYDPALPRSLQLIVQSAMFPPYQGPTADTTMELETPEEELFPPWPQGLLPPPPLPPTTLPKHWKMNVDDEGRCYYYDVRTRISQWTPPSPNSEANSDSEESAGEDSEEEGDSVGATTSGDESALSASGDAAEDQSKALQKFQSWMNNRSERRKRSGLVTERIISPRSEEDKSLSFISQSAIRENKLQAAERKGKKVTEVQSSVSSEVPQEAKDAKSVVMSGQVGNNLFQTEKRMEMDEDEPSKHGTKQSPSPVPTVQKREKSKVQGPATSPGEHEYSPGTKTTSDIGPQNQNQVLPDIETLNLNESLDKSEESVEVIPGLLDGTTAAINAGDEKKSPAAGFVCNSPAGLAAAPTETCSEHQHLGEERSTKRKHKKSKHAHGNVPSATSHHHPQSSGSLSKEGHERERMSDDRKTKAANVEAFRNQIANVIVQHLNPYRKSSCKNGHILSNEDFKHLARKMTHAIALKEMKHSKDGKTIVVNDSVKHKTKEYVKKYMGRFQGNYIRSPEDTQS